MAVDYARQNVFSLYIDPLSALTTAGHCATDRVDGSDPSTMDYNVRTNEMIFDPDRSVLKNSVHGV